MTEDELAKMIDGDSVIATLSDGTDTLEMDLAAEQALLLTLSSPTVVTYESQQINYQGEKKRQQMGKQRHHDHLELRD